MNREKFPKNTLLYHQGIASLLKVKPVIALYPVSCPSARLVTGVTNKGGEPLSHAGSMYQNSIRMVCC